MKFLFYKYCNPLWYNHLWSDKMINQFIDYRKIPLSIFELLDYDHDFESEEGRLIDIAWQAFHSGVVLQDSYSLKMRTQDIPLKDSYRLIRRHLSPFWSWYILAIRLFEANQPCQEFSAFISQMNVRRLQPKFPINKEIKTLISGVQVSKKTLISVVIPTLNRYEYLNDVLCDFEKQDYTNFEIIIVDQSDPYQPKFYDNFKLNIRLIRQEEKALWLARNTAVKMSKGDYIAFSEDDVRIPEYWLSQHLKCLEYFSADISTGSFFPIGTTIPEHAKNFKWAEQFSSGNACVRKEIFHKIGLFDRQFEGGRMGDGEFGIRAHLAGFKSISNPTSWCWDVKAPKGGLRQMGHWDAFRPKSWLAPRPVPSVLYLVRKYFGRRAALYSLLIGVPPSLMPYRLKRKRHFLALGALLVLPLAPLVLWQVWRSWRIASRMLREGAKIESLTDTHHGS